MNYTSLPENMIEKEEFLNQLKETASVSLAANLARVGRATIYRWKKEDEEFAKRVDEARKAGIARVNDIAESYLLKAIDEHNLTAIIFWLKIHHPDYKRKVQISADGNPPVLDILTDSKTTESLLEILKIINLKIKK